MRQTLYIYPGGDANLCLWVGDELKETIEFKGADTLQSVFRQAHKMQEEAMKEFGKPILNTSLVFVF